MSARPREKNLSHAHFPFSRLFILRQQRSFVAQWTHCVCCFYTYNASTRCKCRGYLNFRKCRAAACATDWCILCLALGAFCGIYGERSRRRTTTEPQFPSRSINFTEFHDSFLQCVWCLEHFCKYLMWKFIHCVHIERCGLSSKRKATMPFLSAFGERTFSQLVPRFLIKDWDLTSVSEESCKSLTHWLISFLRNTRRAKNSWWLWSH